MPYILSDLQLIELSADSAAVRVPMCTLTITRKY